MRANVDEVELVFFPTARSEQQNFPAAKYQRFIQFCKALTEMVNRWVEK